MHSAAAVIAAYGSAPAAAKAMVACRMSHVWLRVHGRRVSYGTDRATRDLRDACRRAGLNIAGWGWCQGDDPFAEAELAVRSMRELELNDYVADIEEGVNASHWTQLEIRSFLGEIREKLSGGLALSSFGLITWHSPELIKAAEPHVDVFVPRIYWYDFPSEKMRLQFGHKYRTDDPASFADLCMNRWVKTMLKPLVMTGQAFWEEGFEQSAAEQKMARFIESFRGWSHLIGFNWWSLDTMSEAMRETLAEARVDRKEFSKKGLSFAPLQSYDPRVSTSYE
ncbi:MAG TPA: hypothetical protein VFN10_12320 [Thermoanaerobaculia bacterium]|nr:hypothetical protein [Thermoanaerobaculia bacterium]